MSAFGYKYVLNKILGIRLVVGHNYTNFNVDITTGTGSGYTAYIF